MNHARLERGVLELTGADWIEIVQSGSRGVQHSIIAGFLGCPVENLRTVRHRVAPPLRYNLFVNLDRLLDEWTEGRSEERIFHCESEYDREVRPPIYETVEIGPGRTTDVLVQGTRLVELRGARLAVRTDVAGREPCGWTYIHHDRRSERSTTAARDLLAQIKTRCGERCIYRGGSVDLSLKFLPDSPASWEDLVLAPEVALALRRNTLDLLAKAAIYEANGLPFRRGLILHGPPGTGKTLAGRVLAADRGAATFLWATPRHIEEPRHVRALYQLARDCRPTIVFLEDFDTILAERGGPESRLLGEILSQLDGPVQNAGVVTILTTNHLESLEEALRNRPGRIDVVLEFGPPAPPERARLLARFSGRMAGEGLAWDRIAGLGEGLTGAQLREWVHLAATRAIEEGSLTPEGRVRLSESHFTEAASAISLSSNAPTIGFTR